MENTTASTFLHTLVNDLPMQQQLKAGIVTDGVLTFAHWQHVANQHGYFFTEAEFDTALTANADLLAALEQLVEANGLWLQTEAAFELSETELETVAGGAVKCDQNSGADAWNMLGLKV